MAIVSQGGTGIKHKICQKSVTSCEVTIHVILKMPKEISLTLSILTTSVWQHLLNLGFHLFGAVLFSEQGM